LRTALPGTAPQARQTINPPAWARWPNNVIVIRMIGAYAITPVGRDAYR
jgi:hypothetical protein